MKAPVIYLNCHDAGRLMQPYGHPVPAPHLRRFAEEAVFFRDAHTVAPTCSPSRAGLLTGRFPHQVGMLGLSHLGFVLNAPERHLARRLSQAGYKTALSGVQHVLSESHGMTEETFYDRFLTPKEELKDLDWPARDRAFAERAAAYIEQEAGSGKPFYLECGFFLPHRPFPEPEPGELGGAAVPAYLPDSPRTRKDMRGYAAAMKAADDCFGIVFDALRRTGLDRRAIIIVTTDHGPAFPWAKCNLNDQGTGVMLMMRLPGVSDGRTIDAMVTHLDVLPTVGDVLGLWTDENFEGKSLLPLIDGRATDIHDAIFAEVSYHVAYEPMRSVRTGRYRYIRRFLADWPHPVLPNIDGSPSRDELLDAGLRDQPLPAESLHDLIMDPQCRKNLVGESRLAGELNGLRARLSEWMARTGDPLAAGSVPPPEGAVVVPRDA